AEQLVARLAGEVGEQGKTFRALSVEVEYDAGGRAERTAELRRPAANLGQCSATLRMLVEAVLAVHVGPVAAVGVKLSALAPNRSEQLALFDKAQDRAERRLLLAAAAQEAERRYPARLHRVSPSELPTLLDEYQFSLLPYIPDERRPDPIGKAITSTPAAASTGVCRIERQNGRSYLVEAGRRDELLAVHGCWRAEEWWPKEIERVYWRLRTGSGRILTLARDDDGWRLVEVLD
ncbi:MAG: hypothetical protein WKH64_11400, partial [Chloroflexia bacterium]